MPSSPSSCDDVAECLRDGDLLFVADLQPAEVDHSALLQHFADVGGLPAAEQGVEIGYDFAADSRGQVADSSCVEDSPMAVSSLSSEWCWPNA